MLKNFVFLQTYDQLGRSQWFADEWHGGRPTPQDRQPGGYEADVYAKEKSKAAKGNHVSSMPESRYCFLGVRTI